MCRRDDAMICRHQAVIQLKWIMRNVTTHEESDVEEERFALMAYKTKAVGVTP